jgi:hypothetical protein
VEITGRFNRFAIVDKTKEKTGGTPAADAAAEPEAEDEPACDPSPDPRRPFPVTNTSYSVLQALFRIPNDDEVPGNTKWTAFNTAMTQLGFSAMQTQGSAWQFRPSPELQQDRGYDRGIVFHMPHPENEMPISVMRSWGARLAHVYDWNGTMFQLGEN